MFERGTTPGAKVVLFSCLLRFQLQLTLSLPDLPKFAKDTSEVLTQTERRKGEALATILLLSCAYV